MMDTYEHAADALSTLAGAGIVIPEGLRSKVNTIANVMNEGHVDKETAQAILEDMRNIIQELKKL